MKLALCGGTPAEATKNKIKKERLADFIGGGVWRGGDYVRGL